MQPWLLGEWEGIQKAILLVYYTLYTPSGPVKLSYSNNVCMYFYGNTCYLVRLALGKVIVLFFFLARPITVTVPLSTPSWLSIYVHSGVCLSELNSDGNPGGGKSQKNWVVNCVCVACFPKS